MKQCVKTSESITAVSSKHKQSKADTNTPGPGSVCADSNKRSLIKHTLHKKVKDILKFSRIFFVLFRELALIFVFKSRY